MHQLRIQVMVQRIALPRN